MKDTTLEPSVFNLQQIASLPVTAAHLKKATATDLRKILHFVKEGWPPQVEARDLAKAKYL